MDSSENVLLEKFESEIKNNNVSLLCQLIINDSEYLTLSEYSSGYIKSLTDSTAAKPDLLLSVFLVQYAAGEYNNRNFWKQLFDYFEADYSYNRTAVLGKVFEETLKKYKLFSLSSTSPKRNTYVENIKAHTFMPNRCISDYFDFLYSYYDVILFRQLPENKNDIIDELIECLDSGETGSSGSYRLLGFTQKLICSNVEWVKDKLLSHLSMIDDFYYHDKYPDNDDRFCDAFIKWAGGKFKEKKKRKRERYIHHYSRPKYCFDDGGTYILIPPQKILPESYNGQVTAVISDDKSSETVKLNTKEFSGMHITEQRMFSVSDIFKEKKVTIGNKHFVLKESDYRIFDEEMEEVPEPVTGICYIFTLKSNSVKAENILDIDSSNPGYNRFDLLINSDNETVYVNDEPVTNKRKSNYGINFEQIYENAVFYIDEKQITAAARHPTVSVTTDKTAINGTIIAVNGKRYRLTDFSGLPEEYPENEFTVCVDLNEKIESCDGIYSVMILEPHKPDKKISEYVLLKKLNVHIPKPIYVFEDNGEVDVRCSAGLKPVNCRAVYESKFITDLTGDNTFTELSIGFNERTVRMKIPLNVFRYCSNDDVWSSLKPENLWHTELENILIVSIPGCSEVKAEIEINDSSECIVGEKKGNGLFRFNLLKFINLTEQTECMFSDIYIRYCFDGEWQKIHLYHVLKYVCVMKIDLTADDFGKVYVDVQYEGKDKLKVLFTDFKTGKDVAEKIIDNGRTFFPELECGKKYELKLFNVTSDKFGFNTKSTQIGNLKKVSVR